MADLDAAAAARLANVRSPLAALGGAVPPAPRWYRDAMAFEPEAGAVVVDGTRLETLTWGDPGKPGLLFLHGNGAHAGWWRFIAPFFARDYRCAAFSWSGMGRSDHRPTYSIDNFVAQLFAVAEATGLYAAPVKPLVVAHSFGGFPTAVAAHRHGERLRGAVIVDTPFRRPDEGRERPPMGGKPHRVYATLAEALARFRLVPDQSSKLLFIVDMIARGSLVEVDDDRGTGWTWAFDPFVFARFHPEEQPGLLGAPGCPTAIVWGERSMLMPPERVAEIRAQMPPGTPAIGIPDAAHHVMIDQPLAFVSALRGLFAGWP